MEIREVNAAAGVNSARGISSPETSENYDVNFKYGDTEDAINRNNMRKTVQKGLQELKSKITLCAHWYNFTDHIEIKGDGKLTYGQLREMLGIPPEVLTDTNGKNKIKGGDDGIVEGTIRINLEDIGWVKQTGLSREEEAANENLRRNGVRTAGYDRALTNKDIIKWLEK